MKKLFIIFFTIVIITAGSFITYLTIGDKNKENNNNHNTPETNKNTPKEKECTNMEVVLI